MQHGGPEQKRTRSQSLHDAMYKIIRPTNQLQQQITLLDTGGGPLYMSGIYGYILQLLYMRYDEWRPRGPTTRAGL